MSTTNRNNNDVKRTYEDDTDTIVVDSQLNESIVVQKIKNKIDQEISRQFTFCRFKDYENVRIGFLFATYFNQELEVTDVINLPSSSIPAEATNIMNGIITNFFKSPCKPDKAIVKKRNLTFN